jgi:hypothetical protein
MSKLTNFLNEVLRVNTPVPGLMQRILRKDIQLGKYTILKGANLNILEIPNNNYSKLDLFHNYTGTSLTLKSSTRTDGSTSTRLTTPSSHFLRVSGTVSDST